MDNMNMAAEAAVAMKACSRCKSMGREDYMKPATPEYFPRNKSKKDGLGHWCKKCIKEHRDDKKKGAAPAVAQAIVVDAVGNDGGIDG